MTCIEKEKYAFESKNNKLNNTPSVPYYSSFDFFDSSLTTCLIQKICANIIILEELLLIKQAIKNDILHKFLNKMSGQTWGQKSQTTYNLERI
jgi:hypothetical protein